MKYRIARLIVLLFLLISVSGCWEGRWAKFHRRNHYIHKARKKHYERFHRRHNGDW